MFIFIKRKLLISIISQYNANQDMCEDERKICVRTTTDK